MPYQSILNKIKQTEQTPQETQQTGYKSILKKEKTVTTPKIKSREIKTETLSPFLGGGTYKRIVGQPQSLVKTERTNYGGVPTKTGYERADIFPVSLGGINASSTNITMEKNLPEFESGKNKEYRTATDKYLMTKVLPAYKSGQITLRDAQVKAVSYLRDKQEGLDTSNINLGGKLGEIADNIVSFFKGVKQEKQPEISTKQLAKNISERKGIDTLTGGKSVYKTPEYTKSGMVASKLQLPETNWAYKTINTLYNVPSEAIANLVTKETKLASKLGSETKPLERVAAGVETGTAGVGLIPQWLAFSTGLEASKNVPIVKYPAKGISFVFDKLGKLGAYAGGKIVDISPISDESKTIIRPAVEELSALATQLLGGKKGMEVVGKFNESIKARIAEKQNKGEDITPEIAKNIVDEVKTEIDKDNYNKNVEELVKKPTPENLERAIISKPKETNIEKTTEVKPVKIKTTPKIEEVKPIAPITEQIKTKTIEPQIIKGEEIQQKTITTPETFIPKLAESNRVKAIDLGVKPEEFTKLPEVEKINLQEQFIKAKNIIDSDVEFSRAILRGEEPIPSDVNATQFLAAAEKYLKEHPENKDMAWEIANSELTKYASLAGQEVVSAKLREPDSFTSRMIELKKAREPKIKDIDKKKSQTKKSLKEETKKINLSKEDLSWKKFLDSIEC